MINSKTFAEGVEKYFKWLIDLDFQYRQVDTNIYFEQIKSDEAFAIGFSWSEYNTILVNGLTAYKRFENIEKFLQDVMGGRLDYTIKYQWNGEIPNELERVKDHKYFHNAFYIADTNQLSLFSNLVKEFFENDAQAFFGRFHDLAEVLRVMDVLPSDKKASMIVNTSNSAFLRIMAIKYVVDPSEGEKFYKETVKELRPLKNQKVFNQILQNLESLKFKLPYLE